MNFPSQHAVHFHPSHLLLPLTCNEAIHSTSVATKSVIPARLERTAPSATANDNSNVLCQLG